MAARVLLDAARHVVQFIVFARTCDFVLQAQPGAVDAVDANLFRLAALGLLVMGARYFALTWALMLPPVYVWWSTRVCTGLPDAAMRERCVHASVLARRVVYDATMLPNVVVFVLFIVILAVPRR